MRNGKLSVLKRSAERHMYAASLAYRRWLRSRHEWLANRSDDQPLMERLVRDYLRMVSVADQMDAATERLMEAGYDRDRDGPLSLL